MGNFCKKRFFIMCIIIDISDTFIILLYLVQSFFSFYSVYIFITSLLQLYNFLPSISSICIDTCSSKADILWQM